MLGVMKLIAALLLLTAACGPAFTVGDQAEGLSRGPALAADPVGALELDAGTNDPDADDATPMTPSPQPDGGVVGQPSPTLDAGHPTSPPAQDAALDALPTLPTPPPTCGGCVVNGQCLAGTADVACGSGGQACNDCSQVGIACSDHQCRQPVVEPPADAGSQEAASPADPCAHDPSDGSSCRACLAWASSQADSGVGRTCQGWQGAAPPGQATATCCYDPASGAGPAAEYFDAYGQTDQPL